MRAAIVGAGLMGRSHADAVRKAGHHVSVIVDPDERRARALAAKHGRARVASLLGDVIDQRLADVAHICTPLESHERDTALALHGGMHAIVEKPVAESAAATGRLIALASVAGLLVVPVHQFLFQRGFLALQRALPSAGPLLHIDAVACTFGAEGLDARGRDQVAIDILPHALSIVARLTQRSLATPEWTVLHGGAGELRIVASVGTTTVNIVVSTSGRPAVNMLRVVTASRSFDLDLFHGYGSSTRGARSRQSKLAQPFVASGRKVLAAGSNLLVRAARREYAYPGLRELIARTYAAAAQGSASPISAGEMMDVACVRDIVRDALSRQNLP
ncbi:MAG TPA: Gfo/Idh/MocA family oxidoreductase [Candidatus Elarobacter sp.]|nr:Gfo/Idh/MocA family oxidoreductase [Candidatus Elarobacter sp.]